MRARIGALEADLQELVHVASHDLTEPLRMVTSYLGLLERRYGDQLDGTAHEFIGYAVDGAERMRALLDDLLRYSRTGGRTLELEPVDVGEVLAGELRSLGVMIEQAAASVVVEGELPTVEGDLVQLGQVLQNLVSNAVKFHRPGERPSVVVSAQRDHAGQAWVLQVADDGIGIAPRDQERIFGVFQRLHAREEYAGTGIGLALCRRIVERHGGRIDVVSAIGEGTAFRVVLPDRAADR